jgi:hypothetical protein
VAADCWPPAGRGAERADIEPPAVAPDSEVAVPRRLLEPEVGVAVPVRAVAAEPPGGGGGAGKVAVDVVEKRLDERMLRPNVADEALVIKLVRRGVIALPGPFGAVVLVVLWDT